MCGFRGAISVHGADTGIPAALFAAALDALPRSDHKVILASEKGMLVLRTATDGHGSPAAVKFIPWPSNRDNAVQRVAVLSLDSVAEIREFVNQAD